MPANSGASRLLKTTCATLTVAVVGMLVVPFFVRWNNERIAARLATIIEQTDDASVRVPLRQLEQLGDVAIYQLTTAAASQRVDIATVARQILEEKLALLTAEGERMPESNLSAESITTVEKLASSLAGHVHAFGPAGKQWAEQIAMAMIDLTDQLPPAKTHALLENCSNILSAVPPQGRRLRSVSRRPQQSDLSPLDQMAVAAPQLESLTRVSEKSLEHFARIKPGIRQPPAETTPRSQSATTVIVNPSPSALDWAAPGVTPPKIQPLPQPTVVAKAAPAQVALPKLAKIASQVTDVPPPSSMAAVAIELRQLSNDALFLRLEEAKFFEAGTIRSVLEDRGMVDAEIDLRLKLSISEADERLRFVDDVSRLPTTSASRTFRWLLGDESSEIRLRALTALATTRLPDVVEIAREVAINDDDPRVANFASELIR